jgi:hypothetical protein
MLDRPGRARPAGRPINSMCRVCDGKAIDSKGVTGFHRQSQAMQRVLVAEGAGDSAGIIFILVPVAACKRPTQNVATLSAKELEIVEGGGRKGSAI